MSSLSIELPADAELPERHPDAPAPGEVMPPHNSRCFGCADVPGGLRVVSRAGEGVSVLSCFEVTEAHQGAPGLLYGGLLSAVFDDALGMVPPLLRRPAVTANLETAFRRPVPVGATLWVASHLDGALGRKLYVSATARLDAPDGPVAGTARSLFIQVGREHFLRHGRPEDLEAAGAPPDAISAARR